MCFNPWTCRYHTRIRSKDNFDSPYALTGKHGDFSLIGIVPGSPYNFPRRLWTGQRRDASGISRRADRTVTLAFVAAMASAVELGSVGAGLCRWTARRFFYKRCNLHGNVARDKINGRALDCRNKCRTDALDQAKGRYSSSRLLSRFFSQIHVQDTRGSPWVQSPFPLLLSAPWWALIVWNSVRNPTFLPLTLPTFQANLGRLPYIARIELASLVNIHWSFALPLAAVLALLRVRARRERADLLPSTVVLYLSAMTVAYVFLDYAPDQQHVVRSFDRLVARVVTLFVLWIASNFAAF